MIRKRTKEGTKSHSVLRILRHPRIVVRSKLENSREKRKKFICQMQSNSPSAIELKIIFDVLQLCQRSLSYHDYNVLVFFNKKQILNK